MAATVIQSGTEHVGHPGVISPFISVPRMQQSDQVLLTTHLSNSENPQDQPNTGDLFCAFVAKIETGKFKIYIHPLAGGRLPPDGIRVDWAVVSRDPG